MLNAIQLDNVRSQTMRALYERSGRTCGTHTGLWNEFSLDVAANLRDLDYADLEKACIAAIEKTDSCFSDYHAKACIEVFRKFVLGEKWSDIKY